MDILAIAFLSVFIEGLITYFTGGEKDNFQKARPYIKFIALGIGIALAIAYKVSIPEMIGITGTLPIVDYIISGIIIGRGSNYANDIITAFRSN